MIDRDAGHLRRRVHARVGAARGHERIVGADDHGNLVFDHRLDALRVGLPLPSRIGGAIVGDGDFQSTGGHGRFTDLVIADCLVIGDVRFRESIFD